MTTPKSRTKGAKRATGRSTETGQVRGDIARARIAKIALRSFRKRGFAETTMRDIAKEADVALGAAYYYFPSKEAIVLAYYEEIQAACREACAPVFASEKDFMTRIGVVFRGHFEAIRKDQRLISGLFSRMAAPGDPLSVFGKSTNAVRKDAVSLIEEALAGAEDLPFPKGRVPLFARLLWSLKMGLLLYFVHDESEYQARTWELLDRTLDSMARLMPMFPFVEPMLGEVEPILELVTSFAD